MIKSPSSILKRVEKKLSYSVDDLRSSEAYAMERFFMKAITPSSNGSGKPDKGIPAFLTVDLQNDLQTAYISYNASKSPVR